MSSSSGRRSRSRSRLRAVDYEEVQDTSAKEDPDNYDVHEAQRLYLVKQRVQLVIL